jgi:hypothetical protein
MVVLLGLIVAAVMRARAISNLKPVIVAAARKHTAEIHQSYLGMPQIIKTFHGWAIRMMPMNVSTSSPEGGGEMTCVDFGPSSSDASTGDYADQLFAAGQRLRRAAA